MVELWVEVVVGVVRSCVEMSDTAFRERVLRAGGRRMSTGRFMGVFMPDPEVVKAYVRNRKPSILIA